MPGRSRPKLIGRGSSAPPCGQGRYTLKTSAKCPSSYGGKGLDTPATGNLAFPLGLPAGAVVSASVKKSSGSAATPTFASFSGPQGAVDLGAANPIAFKKIVVPATGLFTLAVAGGNGGKIDLQVKVKYPKGATKYAFDAVEATFRTVTDVRTAWLGSAHADITSEPFAHWNNDSPAVVPKSCAKCHSGLGYQDFLGVLANPLATPREVRHRPDDPGKEAGEACDTGSTFGASSADCATQCACCLCRPDFHDVPGSKCSSCHPAIAPALTYPPGAATTFPGQCE